MSNDTTQLTLTTSLQNLATLFIAARQRSGEALLEAAAYITQARAEADHGEWYLWLKTTHTDPSVAEQLINIQNLAHKSQAFADAVRRNWLGQTTAALLARPSTPTDVIETALNSNTVPTKSQIQAAIKEYRNPDPDQDLPFGESWQDKPKYQCPYCGTQHTNLIANGVKQCPRCQSLHEYSGPRDVEKYGPYPNQQQDVHGLPFDEAWQDDEGEPLTPYEQQLVVQQEARNAHVMRVMGSSESPEWYTPASIVETVRSMFGMISLDPCSNSKTDPNVPAETVYTKEDDGLAQSWYGSVYLNPPYGEEIPKWINRLVQAYQTREIDQAVALLPARIDTVWFQPLYDYPMCNVRGRIKFHNAQNSAPFPCVIVYLGRNEQQFIDTFKALGPIMRRIA